MIESLQEYQRFEIFDSPADMLLAVNPKFQSGEVQLHPWQLKWMFDFAQHTTADNPFKGLVRANNSSGKDRFCIAPCILWLGMRYERVASVVTSSSGRQLDKQTGVAIDDIARDINKFFGAEIWKTNYRKYSSPITGAMFDLFATDEPGKAEGSHPITEGKNSQMGMFISEAKSIPETIFEALTRCIGFTKWVEVSSPGLPNGHFYDLCQDSSIVYPLGQPPQPNDRGWKQYHITVKDCPHIPQSYVDDVIARYGMESPLVKSMFWAEFGLDPEQLLVITRDKINRLFKFVANIEHKSESYNKAGLDLSAGGDESCLVIRNGNKVLEVVPFRYGDTQTTVNRLEQEFEKWDLKSIHSPIWTDAGNMGVAIIDQLRARGWINVQYIYNQSTPFDDRAYVNMGANLWFKLARLIEEIEVILPKDEKLLKQLTNRFYIINKDLRLQLESKLQARSKGHPSPDRADGLVLAFYDYDPRYVAKTFTKHKEIPGRMQRQIAAPLNQRQDIAARRGDQFGYQIQRPSQREFNLLTQELERVNSKIRSNLLLKG